MTIFQDAKVGFLLADYASADASGKLNVVGGLVSFLGGTQGGQAGAIIQSAPFTTVIQVQVPRRYGGQTYALTVELYDITTGQLQQLPTPDGNLEPFRAQQAVTVQPVQLPPGLAVPEDSYIGHTMVMNFLAGMPLAAGHSFEWKVSIDGHTRAGWSTRFHILGPDPGLIIGGPNGPSTIPGVAGFVIDPPEESADGDDPEASAT